MPKYTGWDRLHFTPADPRSFNRFALTRDEEKLIVDLILQYADRGASLRRRHVQEAAEIIIENMPEKRRS